ncbi:MAG: M20/M25/M40 family metallo-hydrolase [Chloroflexi bacterium]|nr:M20/M25/M40 family metallo-hydrolase [Chloroflexota bacterium]
MPDVTLRQWADRLSPFLAEVEDEVAELTLQLLAIPTPNPPGENYPAVVDLLERRFRSLGMATKQVQTPPALLLRHRISPKRPRPSLLGRWGTAAGPSLHFYGHYDVAPAQTPELWTPVLAGGMMVGRGAADMKGGLACIWGALRLLQRVGLAPQRAVSLSCTPDGESGGQTGLGHLVASGELQREEIAFAVSPEPTGGGIWHAAEGAFVWEAEVWSRGAHLDAQAVAEMLQVGQPAALADGRLARPPDGSQELSPALERMVFTVERRSIAEGGLDAARQEVEGRAARLRAEGVDLRLRPLLEAAPFRTPPEHPGVRVLEQALQAASGSRPQLQASPGPLEGRYLAGVGAPTVASGPGRLSVVHSPAECVAVGELGTQTLAFALFLLRFPWTDPARRLLH